MRFKNIFLVISVVFVASFILGVLILPDSTEPVSAQTNICEGADNGYIIKINDNNESCMCIDGIMDCCHDNPCKLLQKTFQDSDVVSCFLQNIPNDTPCMLAGEVGNCEVGNCIIESDPGGGDVEECTGGSTACKTCLWNSDLQECVCSVDVNSTCTLPDGTSGQCSFDGICEVPCKANLASCDSSPECCSNLCGGPGSVCLCTSNGNPCSEDKYCCSGNCTNTGICLQLPSSTCTDTECLISNLECPAQVVTGENFSVSYKFWGTGGTQPNEARAGYRDGVQLWCYYGDVPGCINHSGRTTNMTCPATPGIYTFEVKVEGINGALHPKSEVCDEDNNMIDDDVATCQVECVESLPEPLNYLPKGSLAYVQASVFDSNGDPVPGTNLYLAGGASTARCETGVDGICPIVQLTSGYSYYASPSSVDRNNDIACNGNSRDCLHRFKLDAVTTNSQDNPFLVNVVISPTVRVNFIVRDALVNQPVVNVEIRADYYPIGISISQSRVICTTDEMGMCSMFLIASDTYVVKVYDGNYSQTVDNGSRYFKSIVVPEQGPFDVSLTPVYKHCVDSDVDDNMYVEGQVATLAGGVDTDYCEGNNLYQYSCRNEEESQLNHDYYQCAAGCQDGVCLQSDENIQMLVCGNGIVETVWDVQEECDDGNLENGDGCTELCKIDSACSECGDGLTNICDENECLGLGSCIFYKSLSVYPHCKPKVMVNAIVKIRNNMMPVVGAGVLARTGGRWTDYSDYCVAGSDGTCVLSLTPGDYDFTVNGGNDAEITILNVISGLFDVNLYPTHGVCSDSDPDNNFHIRGEVVGMETVSQNTLRDYNDYCDGDNLYQYRCINDGKRVSKMDPYECAIGCENGICQQSSDGLGVGELGKVTITTKDEDGAPVGVLEVWVDSQFHCITGENGSCVMNIPTGEHILSINDPYITCESELGCPKTFTVDKGDEAVTLVVRTAYYKKTRYCYDPDHGLNYDMGGGIRENVCYDLGTKYARCTLYASSDYCGPSNILKMGDGILREYYCQGGQEAVKEYVCPLGCENGACVQPQAKGQAKVTFNVTTETGKAVYGVKVVLTGYGASCITDINGFCSLRAYAPDNYTASVQDSFYSCLASSGLGCPKDFPALPGDNQVSLVLREIPLQMDYCKDTDNGVDYYEQGVAKDNTTNSSSKLHINVDTCQSNGRVLVEAFCNSNKQARTEQYTCPGDCVGGACLEVRPECNCTEEDAPVCGDDDITYGNACKANCAYASVAYQGRCLNAPVNTPECIGCYRVAYDEYITRREECDAIKDTCKDVSAVDYSSCQEGCDPGDYVSCLNPCTNDYNERNGDCVDVYQNCRARYKAIRDASEDNCNITDCVGGVEAVCGNGMEEEGEECDDGNLVNGDGCSSACQNEVIQPPATCSNNCQADWWGDGTMIPYYGSGQSMLNTDNSSTKQIRYGGPNASIPSDLSTIFGSCGSRVEAIWHYDTNSSSWTRWVRSGESFLNNLTLMRSNELYSISLSSGTCLWETSYCNQATYCDTSSGCDSLLTCGDEPVSCTCTDEINLVCGEDGQSYTNPCRAGCAGITVDYQGECVDLSAPAEATVTPEEGGSVEVVIDDNVVKLEVPPGAVDDRVKISINSIPVTNPNVSDSVIALTTSDTSVVGDYVYDYTATLESTGEPVLSFNQLVIITLPYTDEHVSGLNENDLRVARYDENSDSWQFLATTHYPEQNVIVAQTNHFTVFTITVKSDGTVSEGGTVGDLGVRSTPDIEMPANEGKLSEVCCDTSKAIYWKDSSGSSPTNQGCDISAGSDLLCNTSCGNELCLIEGVGTNNGERRVAAGQASVCVASKDVGVTMLCPFGPSSIEEVVDSISKWVFYLAIIIAPLMIVIGALMFVTSAGDPTKARKGRAIIVWAVIGLALVSFSKVIYGIIRDVIGIQ